MKLCKDNVMLEGLRVKGNMAEIWKGQMNGLSNLALWLVKKPKKINCGVLNCDCFKLWLNCLHVVQEMI